MLGENRAPISADVVELAPCESPPIKALLHRSGLVHTTPEVVVSVDSRVLSGLQYAYP